MVNKYAGQCLKCGNRVQAKAGILKRAGAVWVVEHLACKEGGAVTHIQIGGNDYFRNSRGRCEDAPCCGCCTI